MTYITWMPGFELDIATYSWSWKLATAQSIQFHAAICLIYCVSVWSLQYLMSLLDTNQKSAMRKAFHLDSLKWYHNILLSIVSGFMGITMLISVWQDGRFHSWQDMACKNTPNTGLYGLANLVYLITKIWEWLVSLIYLTNPSALFL